jgi:anti-sigma B factor antagonist
MISNKIIGENRLLINPGRVLDNNNAHEMAELLARVSGDGVKFVIIDMQELEFLASAGVGSILGNVELFRQNGGDLVICNASEKILHVLEMLDLTAYLTIVENEQSASEVCQTET